MSVPVDSLPEWELNSELSIGINPSSSNYLEFKLNLSYFAKPTTVSIRFGDKNDCIAIFDNSNQILAQTPSIFNKSSSKFNFRIVYRNAMLHLYWQWKDSVSWSPLISLSQLPGTTLKNITVKLVQTGTTSVGKWNFVLPDINPIKFDSTAPKLTKFQWLSNQSALLEFDETIDIDSSSCQWIGDTTKLTLYKINPRLAKVFSPKKWPCNDTFSLLYQKITDTLGNTSHLQKINAFYPCLIPIQLGEITVTEIMHNPPSNHAWLPPIKYIEIQNTHTQGRWLTNAKICDNLSCATIPNYWLEPKQLLVLYDAKDTMFVNASFKSISLPIPSFPSFNSTEDSIIIKNQMGNTVYQNEYRVEYHQEPFQLGGYSLEKGIVNPAASTWMNWQSNTETGGSPGYLDTCSKVPNPPQNQFLYSVNQDGTHISLYSIRPFTFEILERLTFTIINDQGIKNPIYPKLQSIESTVSDWLIEINDRQFLKPNYKLIVHYYPYHNQFPLDDTLEIITISAIKNANAQDIIVTEFQFNAPQNSLDFIEFYNTTNVPLNLTNIALRYYYDDSIPRWQIPIATKNYILPAKQCLILCKNAELLRKAYPDLPLQFTVENPIFNGLSADFGLLEIMDISTFTRIHLAGYNSRWHHPEIENTQNITLERVDQGSNATHSWNWISHQRNKIENSPPTSCSTNANPHASDSYTFMSPGYYRPLILSKDPTWFHLNNKKLQYSSSHNYLCLEYKLPMPDCLIQAKILTLSGQLISIPIQKDRIAFNGSLCFPSSNTQKLPKGLYLLSIRCLLPNGQLVQKQLPFSIL